MEWTECRLHTSHEAHEQVAGLLNEQGANGIVIEDSRDREYEPEWGSDIIGKPSVDHLPTSGVVLKAYFPIDERLNETMNAITKALEQLERESGLPVKGINIEQQTIREEDWSEAWKTYYKPIDVSSTLRIVPSWEPVSATDHEKTIIELDPGMAFGTGTHETTLLCLRALETLIQPGDRVIDVGTGSGILSIAAVKLGARHVQAFDLDPVAVKVAKENIERNQTAESTEVTERDLLAETASTDKADVVVANLLSDIVIRMIPSVQNHLKKTGHLLVSGIISSKKAEVIHVLSLHGFTVKDVHEIKDWVAIHAQRMSEV
ncbi:50S ribosomal protein L11 methyltransferase [Geomicrobium sp. JCM 19039]|uniref:50S ribosomal protein L11 methyltransferase n=1 Tax=Geomicrobium sp. JCM 19039 TaxID=1460636 RepID=UPI00045F11D5|nr:50S ribosomal protein L11 methyltransferase [Geomicrobium sp. JCM 19039]GAK11455.1 ribosomal protein L11 methyltransferase [Geomicrobium sp. JCM 19039]